MAIVVAAASCGLVEEATTTTTDPAAATSRSVELERVIDGDSVELIVDGVVEEARLEGINAPELYTLADVESFPPLELVRVISEVSASPTGPW